MTLLDRWVLSFDINLNGLQWRGPFKCMPLRLCKEIWYFTICYYFLVGVADMLTLISCLNLLSSFFKTRQPATQPFLMGNLRDKPIHFQDLLSSKPTSLPLKPSLRETWGSSYLIILHYGKHLFSLVLIEGYSQDLKTCSCISSFFYWWFHIFVEFVLATKLLFDHLYKFSLDSFLLISVDIKICIWFFFFLFMGKSVSD